MSTSRRWGCRTPALANGSIDAAILTEPFLLAAQENNSAVLLLGIDEIIPDYQFSTLYYSPSFAAGDSELGERFMTAYIRGIRDYNAAFVDGNQRSAAIEIMTKRTTIKDPLLFERMAPVGLRNDGRVNVESVRTDQDYYMRTGSQQQAVDLGRVIDLQFVDAAYGGPHCQDSPEPGIS